MKNRESLLNQTLFQIITQLKKNVMFLILEFQSRYYVHFRANTLGKSKNPLILPVMG